ncbi:MAG: SRPBCC family protein, partial [Acidimicrobiia bacterium]
MTGFPVRPVTVAVDIPAEADAVFSVVSDTRRDPEWCPNVTNVKQKAGDGVAVGARFHFDQTIEARGKTLHSGVDVEVEQLGDRQIVWRVEDRFQTRRITLTVVPRQGG